MTTHRQPKTRQDGGKMSSEDYIIRIYRRGKDDPHFLVGILEEVAGEGKHRFTNFSELQNLLGALTPREHGIGPGAEGE